MYNIVNIYGMQMKDSCIDLSHFPLPTSSTGITPGCGGSDSIFVRTWPSRQGRRSFHWIQGRNKWKNHARNGDFMHFIRGKDQKIWS